MTPLADSTAVRVPLAPATGSAADLARPVAGNVPAVDVCQIIESQRLNSFVVRLIVISCLVTFVDGFDLNVIAYAAPYMQVQYSLNHGALGAVFAAGSAGAMVGGLLFGLLGDRVGRRRAIVVAVGMFALFTLLLAAAGTVSELVAARFVGGIALGGALPLIWALGIEYVPTRYRATVVTLMMLGYGVGMCVAGPLSIALIPRYGWQSIFIFGGLASLGAGAVVWFKTAGVAALSGATWRGSRTNGTHCPPPHSGSADRAFSAAICTGSRAAFARRGDSVRWSFALPHAIAVAGIRDQFHHHVFLCHLGPHRL